MPDSDWSSEDVVEEPTEATRPNGEWRAYTMSDTEVEIRLLFDVELPEGATIERMEIELPVDPVDSIDVRFLTRTKPNRGSGAVK